MEKQGIFPPYQGIEVESKEASISRTLLLWFVNTDLFSLSICR
jgi:hypothetical protein